MKTKEDSKSNFKWNTDITFKFQCNQATRKKKKKKIKKEKKKKNKKRKKKKISNNKNKERMKNQSWCKVKG